MMTANIFYDSILLVTILGAALDLQKLPQRATYDDAISALQIIFAVGYCMTAHVAHPISDGRPAPFWALLWLLSTQSRTGNVARPLQIAGLLAVSADTATARVTFAAMAALLTAQPVPLNRVTPRGLCLIYALILAGHPWPQTLPTFIATSGGIAAIFAFLELPVIGFSLLTTLIPTASSYLSGLTLILCSAALLCRNGRPRLDISLPLLSFALLINARYRGNEMATASFCASYAIGLLTLPLLRHINRGAAKWLSLPLPPMPPFLTILFLSVGIAVSASKVPSDIFILVCAAIALGLNAAALLHRGVIEQRAARSAPSLFGVVTCLVLALFPAWTLTELGFVAQSDADGRSLLALPQIVYGQERAVYDKLWAVFAGVTLGISGLVYMIVKRRNTRTPIRAAVSTISLPETGLTLFNVKLVLNLQLRLTRHFYGLKTNYAMHILDKNGKMPYRSIKNIIAGIVLLFTIAAVWSTT